jgi:N-glycosylase/DNA lyase
MKSPNAPVDWTPWKPLADVPSMSASVLAETLDGGQAFRWNRVTIEKTPIVTDREDNRKTDTTPAPATDSTIWQGVWSDHVVRLRLNTGERIEWSAPVARATQTSNALSAYFATAQDFAALADSLPWRSDPHLARCIESFRGLRILRQPFGETLLGFLCSATKQIVQIKQMLALLATRHGAPISPLPSVSPLVSRLPTWPELAEIAESDLRACLLGFRARYIAETARFLAANPGWLEETETLPYAAAKERLCLLPGVGEKVADCVLLFGGERLEAFPVDVWILKTLARRYGLDGWRTPHLAQFGRVHFGPLAGLAQQYLFAWERKNRAVEASGATVAVT